MPGRIALALLGAQVACTALASEPLVLWYQAPAQKWVEALPLGNGRVGAMVFGGVTNEHLQFNEDTLWTGRPHEYQHEGAVKYLPQLRQLLFEGKQREAEALAEKEFMSVPLRQKAYQPFGDVHLLFPAHTNVTNYRRQLDLDTALVTVTYEAGGVGYKREMFASAADQVIASKLSANRPHSISFIVRMDSPHKSARIETRGRGELALLGEVESGGLKFEARLLVRLEHGEITANGDLLEVRDADSATLTLVAATSFNNYKDISGDPAARCDQLQKGAAGKDFDALLKRHLADYQPLFRRVDIDLGSTAACRLPTDQRLKNVAREADPQLDALYFQFGRYLLIASSRPGGQAANLQGLWNAEMKPPWDSKYTVNINTEMNYWPAEVGNLSECAEPLFDLITDCAVSGAKTARAQYGARGWVLHHNTDLWRGTAPINASNHGIWVTGGAWLCHHLWEHYLYTGDKEFLRKRGYPLLKEAALFFVDYLVKDPSTGKLISGPSNSPEEGGLVMGPTMDHQIIRDLFANTAAAATVLGNDKQFADQLMEMRRQIAPNKIGRYGQLQEWLEDKDDPKNTHRHCSHLWGVFPGSEITPEQTPELCAAAKQSLIFRGDGGTGWSKAWKINFWARFRDGEHAYKMLSEALAGNTFPNLFDAHPPFQIDGNFGGTSGVAEMLVQSHLTEVFIEPPVERPINAPLKPTRRPPPSNPEIPNPGSEVRLIDLLPALPSEWANGSVRGLRARGGFEVALHWQTGALTGVEIKSLLGNRCRLRYGPKVYDLATAPGQTCRFDGQLRAL